MKKFLFGIVAVVLLAAAGLWWALPAFLQSRIETYLDQHVPMQNRQVHVVLGSPSDIWQGRIERITAEGDQVQTAGLTYAHLKADLRQVDFRLQRLWQDGEFVVERIGGGEVSAFLSAQELQRRLRAQIDAVQNVQVDINTERIAVSGELSLGNLALGRMELEGVPLLKDNRLVMLPSGLRLNRWGISGINSSLMKTVDVYDFRQFPIPVTAQKVELRDGMVVIAATPYKGN